MHLLQTPIAQALGAVVTGICAMVAHYAGRRPAQAVLLCAVHARLIRLVLRLDRLAHRWRTGTLPAPRPARPGRPRPVPDTPAPDTPAPRLPGGRAWLIALVQPTAQFTGQVQAVLDDPQTRALVEAVPRAGRHLRPLCRGLLIDPPAWLRLPGAPEPPPPRPARPRRSWPPRETPPAPIGPFPQPPYPPLFAPPPDAPPLYA